MSVFATGLEAAGALPTRKRVAMSDQDGTILEFDATVREVHSGSSQPTDHPVEDGSVVTDHVIDQPDELELTAIVSNFPILILASARSEPSVKGGDPRTRAEDAYAAIRSLRKAATLVAISTSLREYENMLILRESATRDKDTTEILDIQISLRAFRVATSEEAEIPEPTEKNDGPKADQGRKQTTDASPAVQAKTDSLFVELADFVGGF